MRSTALSLILLGLLSSAAAARPALIQGQLSQGERAIFLAFSLENTNTFLAYSLQGNNGAAIAASIKEKQAQPIMVLGDEAYLWAQKELPASPLIALGISFDVARKKGRSQDKILLRDLPLSNKFTILRTLFPNLKTIGLVYSPQEEQEDVSRLIETTADQKLRLATVKIDSPATLAAQLPVLKGNIDLLWQLSGPSLNTPQASKTISAFCQENKIPFLASDPDRLAEGGSLSLRVNPEAEGIFAARWAKDVAALKPVPSIAFPEKAELVLSLSRTLPLAGSEKELLARLAQLLQASHEIRLQQ